MQANTNQFGLLERLTVATSAHYKGSLLCNFQFLFVQNNIHKEEYLYLRNLCTSASCNSQNHIKVSEETLLREIRSSPGQLLPGVRGRKGEGDGLEGMTFLAEEEVGSLTWEYRRAGRKRIEVGRKFIRKLETGHSVKKRSAPDTVFYFSTLSCLDEMCSNVIGNTDCLC